MGNLKILHRNASTTYSGIDLQKVVSFGGAWSLVLCSWFLVFSPLFLVLGSCFLFVASGLLDQRYLDLGSWFLELLLLVLEGCCNTSSKRHRTDLLRRNFVKPITLSYEKGFHVLTSKQRLRKHSLWVLQKVNTHAHFDKTIIWICSLSMISS